MKARFSTFKHIKEVAKCDGHHTTRVTLEVPHRMMLCDLSIQDLVSIRDQAERLIQNHGIQDRTIYLGSLECVEEVENNEVSNEATS